MPAVTPRFTDKKARLVLPARFANSAVLIEELSETELRVRKAVILPEDELPFTEEQRPPLSDADRDFVLGLLDRAFERKRRPQEGCQGTATPPWVSGPSNR